MAGGVLTTVGDGPRLVGRDSRFASRREGRGHVAEAIAFSVAAVHGEAATVGLTAIRTAQQAGKAIFEPGVLAGSIGMQL